MKDEHLSLRTRNKQELTLVFLSASLLGIMATSVLSAGSDAVARAITSLDTIKKKDIFKVIMTIQGLDHNSGDIVTIVSVNGDSRVKLFDDAKTYIQSVNASDGTGGIIEYVATFPNVTVNAGDVYKACVLTTKDLNMVCNTGQNSPASRPEFVDISLNATSTTLSDETISEESDEVDEGNGD